MNPTELHLDAPLLLQQLHALGEIGADPVQGGRTRIALTDADKAGRDQLVRWMQALALDIRVDQIGNIFGILRASPAEDGGARSGDSDGDSDDEGNSQAVMIGSHIDTVRHAGALDGCYGVLAGLAVVRAYRAAGLRPARDLVVAAFTNEEGVRYQPDMMGSLVYAGGLPVQAALDTVGTDGSRLGDALARIGYAGPMAPGRIRPRQYLELHIEQGPLLASEGLQIGAVHDLQGISWQQVRITGTANHAGTTPTRLRHDAGYVAAACTVFLREQLAAAAPGTTLATVGSLRLEPDLINVIPRQASFTVDLRDPDAERLAAAERRFAAFLAEVAARERVTVETQSLVRCEPVVFDAALVACIEAAAARRGLPCRRMTSGAGHDAQMMARMASAAMIFVPSRDGISHNPREHTDDAQLIQGAQVLLDVVQACLAQP